MTEIFDYGLPRLLENDDEEYERASRLQSDENIEEFIHAVNESGLSSLLQEEINNRSLEKLEELPAEANFHYNDKDTIDTLQQCLTLLSSHSEETTEHTTKPIFELITYILSNPHIENENGGMT